MDITIDKMDLEMRIRFHGAMMNVALESCKSHLAASRRTMVEVNTAVNAMDELVEKDHHSGNIIGVNENRYLIDIKANDLRNAWKAVLDRDPKFPGSAALTTRIDEILTEAAGLSRAVRELQQETCERK